MSPEAVVHVRHEGAKYRDFGRRYLSRYDSGSRGAAHMAMRVVTVENEQKRMDVAICQRSYAGDLAAIVDINREEHVHR